MSQGLSKPKIISQSPQTEDAGNSALRTVAEGAATFTGAWALTLPDGVVRETTVLASNEPATLGGTFTFEYSDDGIVNNGISEVRPIQNFSAVRDFDLMNFGMYYRVIFTPSRALVGAEIVSIKTILHTQFGGAFVRLANQQVEEANSAMPQTFVYVKAFNEVTGRSENIRVENGGLRVSTAKAKTYRGAFRNAASPFALSIGVTAMNPVQVASLWHAASSLLQLKIKKCVFHMRDVSNAGDITVDLLRITTQPTGGTVITPSIADPADPAPEAVSRALPAVAGAEAAVIYTFGLKLSNSDKNISINLLDELAVNDIKAPTILAGVGGGFAIVVRSSTTTTLTGYVDMTFAETQL